MNPLVFTGIPIGLAFGYVLSRGRFCMNSAFRDIIVMKDYNLIKAVGIAILVSMFGFAIMSAAGVITVNPKPLMWGANMIGGFIFGMGMVIAGGCAGGITYRTGEGMVGAMSAVLGFSIFATTTSAGALKPVASFLQTNTKVTFADGATPTLAFGAPYHVVALIISIVALVVWFALSRRGRTTIKREAVPLNERIFKKGWGWLATGIVIGIIAICAFPASAAAGRNYPLGITGGYVALYQALRKLVDMEAIPSLPIRSAVAATSVGVVGGEALLDLCYEEDCRAEVDFNVVMTGQGLFVEVQGTAEVEPFSRAAIDSLLSLAEKGIRELLQIQASAIGGLQG